MFRLRRVVSKAVRHLQRVLGTQLSKSKLLLDSSLKLDIAAEYNGVTYGFATADALNEFIDAPDQFVNPLPDMMPRKIRGMEMLQVNAGLAGVVALEGCCAVALTIGTAANQTVVQGSDLCMVEYDDQVYRMATTAGRDKFLRSPELYFEAELPAHAAAIDHGKAPSVGKLPQQNHLAEEIVWRAASRTAFSPAPAEETCFEAARH